MAIAKKQLERIAKVCRCGCGQTFYPFPVYRSKADGGGLTYPEYKRGHHPKTRKSLKTKGAWNRGLRKGDHPSLEKMGFQPGHEPFNDWQKINERLKTDLGFRDKWLAAKRGQVCWNKGLTISDYPNGVATGSNHGNWCGGNRGVRDTAKYARFRRSIFQRDNFTCQKCGDRNHIGRGSRIRLEVHHLVALSENHELVFVPENAVTLCHNCHVLTENYGTKLVHKRRKQGRN